MLADLEYRKFIYKLNAAKEAYKKSRRAIDFMNFLKSYKFPEEGSSFFAVEDCVWTFHRNFVINGIFEDHRDDPEVLEIMKEVKESEDFRKSEGFKLTPAQQKAKVFFEAIEAKKKSLLLPECTIYLINLYVKETSAYGFNSIEVADFYRTLADDAKWLFAVTFMEWHLDSMIMSPFINTNYDPELPIIQSKFKAASKSYLLNTMGASRKPKVNKKTEEIMATMKQLNENGQSGRLKEYTMDFFAESATFRKHMHTGLGISDLWWRQAVEELYRENEAKYFVLAGLLSENKKVGIARKTKAAWQFAQLLNFETQEVCPFQVAMEIPDTTAGEIFDYVRENKDIIKEAEYDAIITHFNRHYVQYVSIDEKPSFPKIINAMNGDTIMRDDILRFLKDNLITINYGTYNYVENHFINYGYLPMERSFSQLQEIKKRIAAIQKEIKTVQEDYCNKVLSRFN